MFVCTANTLNIASIDRMEIIRIPGYTDKEKNQIAQKYLVPANVKSWLVKKELNLTQNKSINGGIQERQV